MRCPIVISVYVCNLWATKRKMDDDYVLDFVDSQLDPHSASGAIAPPPGNKSVVLERCINYVM